MTTGAWIMLGITWTIVASVTIYFFSAVLRRKGD
jgi:hypothetical protein